MAGRPALGSVTRPQLRPAVIEARERLRSGRERIGQNHRSGLAGFQVCTSLADLYDGVVLSLWEDNLRQAGAEEFLSQAVLVAHGGFGRRDLAPFSDVDLMLVPKTGVTTSLQPFLAQFTRDIFDAGLDLGFSTRTVREACRWAWKDPTVFSSLSESRLLAGSVHLFQSYFHRFRQGALRRQQRLIQAVSAAREEERKRWGESDHLLSPNVKRSRGGLRDIQFIRWLGFATYGESDLSRLVQLGDFPEDDYSRVRAALAFMLRLRNELHFAAGKSQDILDRADQVAIADRWGYQTDSSQLAVEKFMKDYFEHSRNVRYAAAHYLATTTRNPLWTRGINRLLSRALDPEIRIGPYNIWVQDRYLGRFAEDLPSVLRLMDYSNRFQRRIEHRTWQAIRAAMMARPIGELDVETGHLFLSLLSQPGRLGSLLRRLHELRVLEKIIPAMQRARGMLEFNQYHKYAVDAHSIRAVHAATQFANEQTLAGDVYRAMKDKRLLHLALLLHDLGKGYPEDHCLVGMQIARKTCPRLGLDTEATEVVAKLIKLHLDMNNMSARHDLSDPEIVSRFAATVESMQMLDLLLIHSLADMTAVGPEVLTDWKRRLLEELYVRTRQYFHSGHLPGAMDQATVVKREQVQQMLLSRQAPAVSKDILASLSVLMLQREDAVTLADQVTKVAELDQQRSICWFRPVPQQKATQYTLVRRQQSTVQGLFARAAGLFVSEGLEIQRAEVATLEPDIAWDYFVVSHPVNKRFTEIDCQRVCQKLADAIDSQHPPEVSVAKYWKPSSARRTAVLPQPTRVSFDNETIEKYTVLSLFAYDRPGLLYSIAKTLADQSISTHFAKISTHLDQVLDIFYVTHRDGTRLTIPERNEELRKRLIEAAEGQSPNC